jgi:tetratricopeptide (TPR) repeat protein
MGGLLLTLWLNPELEGQIIAAAVSNASTFEFKSRATFRASAFPIRPALMQSRLARRELANARDADVHLAVHVQKHLTGILHPPILIGHGEAGAGCDCAAVPFNRHGQREVVLGAVDLERALHLEVRFSLLGKGPDHALGKENDLRIARAFEDLVVHVGIAIVIAALAAGCVHHDFACRVTRLRIELDDSALQLERAVDGVHRGAQRPRDLGLRRIECDLHLLRGADTAQQQEQSERDEPRRSATKAGTFPFHVGNHSRVFNRNPGFHYNMDVRFRYLILAVVCLCLTGAALAQEPPVEQVPVDKSAPPPADNREAPPRADNLPPGESSSKQTQIDIAPPANDAKTHPEADLDDTGVDEFTPWNPMKAMKDIEVGDFYYKQENYKAAISRYREALEYKPHDAEATYKLAEALNKTGDTAGAVENYESYLKILPNGPYAKKAHEALEKLKAKPTVAGK